LADLIFAKTSLTLKLLVGPWETPEIKKAKTNFFNQLFLDNSFEALLFKTSKTLIDEVPHE
jgi:hypothetical protein